jgi:hypothetical protein
MLVPGQERLLRHRNALTIQAKGEMPNWHTRSRKRGRWTIWVALIRWRHVLHEPRNNTSGIINNRRKVADAMALFRIGNQHRLDSILKQSTVKLQRLFRGRTAIQLAANIQRRSFNFAGVHDRAAAKVLATGVVVGVCEK